MTPIRVRSGKGAAYPAGEGWTFEVGSVEEFWALASLVAGRVLETRPRPRLTVVRGSPP